MSSFRRAAQASFAISTFDLHGDPGIFLRAPIYPLLSPSVYSYREQELQICKCFLILRLPLRRILTFPPVMATSPPPNISAHSPRTRSRVSSTASGDVPELHRVPNGRIARARSASDFQLSEHNRRAFWTAATGRPPHLVSAPDANLTAALASLAPPNTCLLSTSTLASLEAIASSASVSRPSSILDGSVDPQTLKSVCSRSPRLAAVRLTSA